MENSLILQTFDSRTPTMCYKTINIEFLLIVILTVQIVVSLILKRRYDKIVLYYLVKHSVSAFPSSQRL